MTASPRATRLGQWVIVTAAPSLRVGPGGQPVQIADVFDTETVTVLTEAGKSFMLSHEEGDRWEPVTASNVPLISLLEGYGKVEDELDDLIAAYQPDPELLKSVVKGGGVALAADPIRPAEGVVLAAVTAIAAAVAAGATSDEQLETYYEAYHAAPLEEPEAQLLAIRLALVCAASSRRGWLNTGYPGALAWHHAGDPAESEACARAACLVSEGLNVLTALVEGDEG